jgi:hypothetical protein
MEENKKMTEEKFLNFYDDLDLFDLDDTLEVTAEQKDKAANIENYRREAESGAKPIRSSEENRKQLRAQLRNKKNGRTTGSTPMPAGVAELFNNPEFKKFFGGQEGVDGSGNPPDMKKMIKSLAKNAGAGNHGAKVDTSGVERLLKQLSKSD